MRSNRSAARGEDRASAAAVSRDLAALSSKSVAELADQYLVLFDEPTRSRNREYLIKRMSWRLQEIAEGGLSPRALEQIDKLAPRAPVRWQPQAPAESQVTLAPPKARDPRLPAPGEWIRRIDGGKEHQVKVREHGFEYDGEVFRSLSGVARKITGVSWNGYRYFFGCAEPAGDHKAGAQ
jgi:hypothetical protein